MEERNRFYTSENVQANCRACRRNFVSHDVRDIDGDGMCPECTQVNFNMQKRIEEKLRQIQGSRTGKVIARPPMDGQWVNVRQLG